MNRTLTPSIRNQINTVLSERSMSDTVETTIATTASWIFWLILSVPLKHA